MLDNQYVNATTYTANSLGTTIAASATNIAQLIGSATKTVAVTKITVSGIATAAATQLIKIIKQSAADTSGTPVAKTAFPYDSTAAAATAAFNDYTANPTPGAAVGTVATAYLTLGAVAALGGNYQVFDFSNNPVILRGVAQALAINLNGVTIATGGLLQIHITWVEY